MEREQFILKRNRRSLKLRCDKKGDLHEPVDLATQDVPKELPASLQVGDLEVTAESPLKELRAACRLWNLGQSVYKRLVTHSRTSHLKRQYDQMIEGSMEASRQPREVVAPKAPSPEESKRHVLTHLPYASWCQYCVQYKARERRHEASIRDA